MDKEFLVREIVKWQEKLVHLVSIKQFSFSDPEVYQCSCLIDQLIVQYMKISR